MRSAPASLSSAVTLSGSAALTASIVLVVSQAPLGSPLYFALAATLVIAFALLLVRVWVQPIADRRALRLALIFAVLFRIPLTFAPVGADSDMVRYLWDGRVQRLGYNPYTVVPADPALAHTHTAESVRMPSLRVRTPYPPAAQLFFRLVVTVWDSTRAMKIALLACDLLTIVVLRQWLAASGRNEWLTIAYAWNPLVILEVAHSGHVDALGALWIAATAYWLTRRRTMLAAIGFVLAVATKLLPIVLLPLLIGRVRARDALAGAVLLAFLYLPFYTGGSSSLGAVPNVVAYIRFNGPLFLGIAAIASPTIAAGAALLSGLGVAAVARWRTNPSDPAAWAWPMGVALAGAPVIYPWYLLYLTPFLWTRSTLPLLAWCISGLSAYVVWDLSRHGGRWIVPASIQAFELLVPLVMLLWVFGSSRGRTAGDTVSEPSAEPDRSEPTRP